MSGIEIPKIFYCKDSFNNLKEKYGVNKDIDKIINYTLKSLGENSPQLSEYKNDYFIDEIADFITIYNQKNYREMDDLIRSFMDKTDLAEQILKRQPLYYDKYRIWWSWNKKEYKWEVIDETDILNLVRINSTANTVGSKEKAEILESLRQEARMQKPQEINPLWIQFKDKIYSLKDGTKFDATSDYFVTNPIPWEMSKSNETPVMDKIFEEWVGKDYVQTLYEILAYCLIPDYPLNRIFCFLGAGMNGKSKYLELLRKFTGESNCCSTELDTLLNSRFEVTRLHKKLVCQMGETNFNQMDKTSILKKLSGGDLMGFEYKRKDPFEEVNYAKIIIATNNLPSTSDKTVGFYRRWLLIDFPNQFTEAKDILAEIPQEEYHNLANKCFFILKDLLIKRKFTNEGSIEERQIRYEEKSNPLGKFWDENILEDYDSYIPKHEFTKKLRDWCKENNVREITDRSIIKFMKDKELREVRRIAEWTSKEGTRPYLRCWSGIKFK